MATTVGSSYWNEWNRDWRFRGGYDEFMRRQLDVAMAEATRIGLRDARILDIGCGTGWLGNELARFGKVIGTDLSEEAIANGRARYPDIELICGDFMSVQLEGSCDFIVSADSFAHMPNHAQCVQRIADLLSPRGTFLLMTQNPEIWRRRSKLRKLPDTVPHSNPSEWPSLTFIKQLLKPRFEIRRIATLDPGGDTGLLWWVENRYVRGGVGRLIGRKRWRSMLETARLGRELVVVARRRD